jgi:hypothetical protein
VSNKNPKHIVKVEQHGWPVYACKLRFVDTLSLQSRRKLSNQGVWLEGAEDLRTLTTMSQSKRPKNRMTRPETLIPQFLAESSNAYHDD